MKKMWLAALLLLTGSTLFAQVVVNELDTDTPGTDTKEFIELKTTNPFTALDGYVLVLINGGDNKVYYNLDLDGLTTDDNGIILIGSQGVAPVPSVVLVDGLIQNGPDAVAVYLGNPSNYPYGSTATASNLVSALVYDTSDADATSLMNILGVTVQYDENANSNGVNESVQRKTDGTYETKAPTPGANNDGSGIAFNGLTISVPAAEYIEGNFVPVTITTQTPVTQPLTVTLTLDNDTFGSADFTGNLSITFPVGATSFTAGIILVDDSLDEGDEVMRITMAPLPSGYVMLNNKVDVRIIDNDYTVASYGTPVNPTYGIVTPTIPAGYYSSLEGKSGAALKQAIQDIIANPATVHAQNYGDIIDILKAADQSPLNSNQVWLMYVEQQRPKYKFQSTASNTGSWNREHIYPQSRGGFSDGTSSTADGIDIYNTTNADDLNAGHGDGHHIRAEDGPENSSRNNRDYGLTDYNGPVNNLGSWHGDVARALFYMACRYNVLSLVNGNPPDTTLHQLGDLATLLTWNQSDPADDFEMHHNNVVYLWQNNRNPFVDMPNLANYVYGNMAGQVWSNSLATTTPVELQVGIYPNPAHDQLAVSGIDNGTLTIYALTGAKVLESSFEKMKPVQFTLPNGLYMARIVADGKVVTKKLIVR